ncbi:hypothetical protein Ancab_017186 [Ancistrocladus abbreviatus]
MEECMRDCMRKLALWYTRTFKPIMTHEELEPIMATLGFVGRPPKPAANGVVWKEYVYTSACGRRNGSGGGLSCSGLSAAVNEAEEEQQPMPKPRLPYQRIDGLHIYTYHAFIDAVNFYLQKRDISDLFHIRGMPLHPKYDRNKKFRRMDEDESVFVHREGTLDPGTLNFYRNIVDADNKNSNTANGHKNSYNYDSSIIIRNKGSNLLIGNIVPLKDIIV